MKKYMKPAFVQAAIGALLLLVLGFAVATVTQNIGTNISVQSYSNIPAQITTLNNIIDANTLDGDKPSVVGDINATLVASFDAQRINAQNTPLMSQAVFLGVIIVILFGSISATMGGYGSLGSGSGGNSMSF